MAAGQGWVRAGEPPQKQKISFMVDANEYPELSEWLWKLPFRKTSEIVRDVLSEAAKHHARNNGEQQPAPTSRAAASVPVAPAVEIAALHRPAAHPPTQPHQAMTEGVAAVLAAMDAEF